MTSPITSLGRAKLSTSTQGCATTTPPSSRGSTLQSSLKRVGITYSFDNSSSIALSDASKALFTNLAFRGISGPNALSGIITSKMQPSFSMNTLDAAYQPHSGKQLFVGGEFAGLG